MAQDVVEVDAVVHNTNWPCKTQAMHTSPNSRKWQQLRTQNCALFWELLLAEANRLANTFLSLLPRVGLEPITAQSRGPNTRRPGLNLGNL